MKKYKALTGKDRKNTGGCLSRSNRKCADSQSVGYGFADQSFDV